MMTFEFYVVIFLGGVIICALTLLQDSVFILYLLIGLQDFVMKLSSRFPFGP